MVCVLLGSEHPLQPFNSVIMKLVPHLLACSLFSASAAFALTPNYQTFGDLSGATFGGSGIPTDPTAFSVFSDQGRTVTIGLTAHQRYSNPALTNDGAGTFFATPGTNDGTPGQPGTTATWNFAYYISVTGSVGTIGTLANYNFALDYEFNPTSGSTTGFGSLNLNAFAALAGQTNTYQESQNPTFGFLGSSIPGFVTAPADIFDANALGEYSFRLRVSPTILSPNSQLNDYVSINVVVGNPTTSVPDGGATIALLGVGLLGMAVLRRRV